MVSVQSVLTVDPGLNPTPENINRISLIPQAKENDFNDQIVKKIAHLPNTYFRGLYLFRMVKKFWTYFPVYDVSNCQQDH